MSLFGEINSKTVVGIHLQNTIQRAQFSSCWLLVSRNPLFLLLSVLAQECEKILIVNLFVCSTENTGRMYTHCMNVICTQMDKQKYYLETCSMDVTATKVNFYNLLDVGAVDLQHL